MFSLHYSSPCKIKGTIKVKGPIVKLGRITDINGICWDIHGIFGAGGAPNEKQWVWAVPYINLHPYYTDTSTRRYDLVCQTWEPYYVEIAE